MAMTGEKKPHSVRFVLFFNDIETSFKSNQKCLNLVPKTGLEPARCYSLVPETSASTNSATWASQER